MNLSITDAQQLFTKELVAILTDRKVPKAFLRSFFIETESWTKEIATQTSRVAELISSDVVRGTEGTRNIFGLSTEKLFIPPYFKEFFDATQLDGYDQLYGDPSALVSTVAFDRFLQTVSEKLMLLQDKIDRAYELQCAQVFYNGVITLVNGDNIDYKRKTASIVDLGSGGYWTGASVDPNTALQAAGDFIRQFGKAEGTVFNVLMGSAVQPAYVSNAAVLKRGAIFNWSLDNLVPAQRNSVGAVFQGRISAGPYNFNLWSYPEIYEKKDASGNITKYNYLDSKSIVVLPENTRFVLSYAAVPQLLSTGAPPVKGKFIFYNYPDLKNETHEYGIKSAGVAIPVAVDQIYTAKVLA
jgi:Phage major capsid protein E